MKRRFTPRETLLLTVLAALLLVVCYGKFVWEPSAAAISQAESQITAAQTELDLQTLVAQRMREMEHALAPVRSQEGGPQVILPEYNNLENVIMLLNDTLAPAADYGLNFLPVVFDGNMAQRTVTMTFTCNGYTQAKAIVSQLYGGPYRCAIGDFSMRAVAAVGETASLTGNQVNVSLSVTYYESGDFPEADREGA